MSHFTWLENYNTLKTLVIFFFVICTLLLGSIIWFLCFLRSQRSLKWDWLLININSLYLGAAFSEAWTWRVIAALFLVWVFAPEWISSKVFSFWKFLKIKLILSKILVKFSIFKSFIWAWFSFLFLKWLNGFSNHYLRTLLVLLKFYNVDPVN